jgi:hypothetical protein
LMITDDNRRSFPESCLINLSSNLSCFQTESSSKPLFLFSNSSLHPFPHKSVFPKLFSLFTFSSTSNL